MPQRVFESLKKSILELEFLAEHGCIKNLNWKEPIMRALFKKRQNIFIKIIHKQAALILEGFEALQTYFENNEAANAIGDIVVKIA